MELERTREKPTPISQETLAATREISLPRIKEKTPSEEEKVIDSNKNTVNFCIVEDQPPTSPMKKSRSRESEFDSPGGRQSGQKQKKPSMYASSHKTQETPGRNILILEESVPLDQWTSDGYDSQNSDF